MNSTKEKPLPNRSVLNIASVLASFNQQHATNTNVKTGFGDVLKKKYFPAQLKMVLKVIPGNDVCPDCDLRMSQTNVSIEMPANSYLPWAQ